MKTTLIALVIATFGITSAIYANEPVEEAPKVEAKAGKKVKKVKHQKHEKHEKTTSEEHKEEAAPAPSEN